MFTENADGSRSVDAVRQSRECLQCADGADREQSLPSSLHALGLLPCSKKSKALPKYITPQIIATVADSEFSSGGPSGPCGRFL